jgi:omega-amidase
MKIIGCQFDIRWEDREANHTKVLKIVQEASPAPGSLIVLPEMFASGFSMNVDAIAEDLNGPTQTFLSNLAAAFKAFVLGGIVTRHKDGRGMNQAVIYAPSGEEIGRYSKMHPFSYAGETDHYAPGQRIEIFTCGAFLVAPLVCYDLRFPEAFRAATRKGAQLFTVIANWPAAREDHWLCLLKARAIENQAFVIGINRCGADPNNSYSGRSLILDPRGAVLADAGTGEGRVEADLDIQKMLSYRKEFPALEDMRTDL